MGDHEGTLQFKYANITMKTKLILKQFGGTFGTLRFIKRSFSNISLGFTPYWDYKSTSAIHADSPAVQTSDKIF